MVSWIQQKIVEKTASAISTIKYLFLELLDQKQQKYCMAMAKKPTNAQPHLKPYAADTDKRKALKFSHSVIEVLVFVLQVMVDQGTQ